MSRDVLALCLAFNGGGSVDEVGATAPGGLGITECREFCRVLIERSILVENEEGAVSSLGARRPYVPRLAVYQRVGDDAIVYGRHAEVRLAGGAALLSAANGRCTLDSLSPRSDWSTLLRLCEADVAALKLLPVGDGMPRWAESTMPWPEVDPRVAVTDAPVVDPSDLGGYHASIRDPESQFDEIETTLSHLFREPHKSLGGETFGARLARGLADHGALDRGARIVEVGGGLGWVGRAVSKALAPRSYLVVDRSPSLARAQRERGLLSVVGDATRLCIGDRTVDLLISNEMAGDLGTADGSNHGALRLVDECARVLAPGGLAYISEFGHPSDPPRRSDHLDHDEYSLRFDDLRARAVAHGLSAELVTVPRLIGLDGDATALVTTRASYAALHALFAAHGARLEKRAWLIDELAERATCVGIDLATVHGIATAPIGERTMGLRPNEFWALIARRPA